VETPDANPSASAVSEADLLEHLAGLGYLDLDADAGQRARVAQDEWDFNHATALLEAGETSQAESLARDLRERNPGDKRPRQALCQALLRQGRAEEAGSELAEIEKAHGRCRWSRGQRLVLALTAGHTDEAHALAEVGVAEEPSSPLALALRGRIRLIRRDWPAAEADFRASLALEPENSQACMGLARALVRQNRDDEALDWALQAVELTHLYPEGHFQLGAILSKRADYARAVTAFDTCVRLAPRHRMAHRYLSRLHKLLGDHEKAALHHVLSLRVPK
jgi:tetratricopeptide (TPR) repeat protein